MNLKRLYNLRWLFAQKNLIGIRLSIKTYTLKGISIDTIYINPWMLISVRQSIFQAPLILLNQIFLWQ